MTDQQAREQVLSCLEDVKLDLEEMRQHTSAVVVGQAIEEIEAQSAELKAKDKTIRGIEGNLFECRERIAELEVAIADRTRERDGWQRDFDSLAKKLTAEEKAAHTWHSRYENQRQAAEASEKGAKAAESRLDRCRDLLRDVLKARQRPGISSGSDSGSFNVILHGNWFIVTEAELRDVEGRGTAKEDKPCPQCHGEPEYGYCPACGGLNQEQRAIQKVMDDALKSVVEAQCPNCTPEGPHAIDCTLSGSVVEIPLPKVCGEPSKAFVSGVTCTLPEGHEGLHQSTYRVWGTASEVQNP